MTAQATATASGATPDRELVAAAQRGDRTAFGVLMRRYEGLVSSIATRTVSRGWEREDLTQEIWLQAWLSVRTLREPDKFPGWLSGLARNVCRHWLASERRRPLGRLDEDLRDSSSRAASRFRRPTSWLRAAQSAKPNVSSSEIRSTTDLPRDRRPIPHHGIDRPECVVSSAAAIASHIRADTPGGESDDSSRVDVDRPLGRT